MAPPDEAQAIRAAKLSRVPGVTIDEACKRFGVAKSAVQHARREVKSLSVGDLALAGLTRNGSRKAGTLDLAGVAKWIDYLNHDACNEADVLRLLAPWVESGALVIEGTRWRLTAPWP